jgi:hypothetical protein
MLFEGGAIRAPARAGVGEYSSIVDVAALIVLCTKNAQLIACISSLLRDACLGGPSG